MTEDLSESKPATQKVQQLINSLAHQINAKADCAPGNLLAISYCTQIVAGKNYFVKVRTADRKCLHVKIFISLPHHGSNIRIEGIQKNKRFDEQILKF